MHTDTYKMRLNDLKNVINSKNETVNLSHRRFEEKTNSIDCFEKDNSKKFCNMKELKSDLKFVKESLSFRKSDYQSINNEKEAINTKIPEYENRFSIDSKNLTHKLSTLKSEISNDKDKREYSKNMKKQENVTNDLCKENKELKKQVKILADDLKDSQNKYKQISKEKQESYQDNKNLKYSLEKSKQNYDKLHSENQKITKSLNHQILIYKKLQVSYNDLTKTSNKITQSYQCLQDEISSLQDERSNLLSQIETKENLLKEKTELISEQELLFKEKVKTIKDSDNEIKEKNNNIIKLHNDIKNMNQNNTSNVMQETTYLNEINSLKVVIKSLMKDNSFFEEEQKSVNKQISVKNNEQIKNLQQNYDHVKNDQEILRHIHNEKCGELDTLTIELEMNQKDLIQTQSTLETVLNDLEKANCQVKKLNEINKKNCKIINDSDSKSLDNNNNQQSFDYKNDLHLDIISNGETVGNLQFERRVGSKSMKTITKKKTLSQKSNYIDQLNDKIKILLRLKNELTQENDLKEKKIEEFDKEILALMNTSEHIQRCNNVLEEELFNCHEKIDELEIEVIVINKIKDKALEKMTGLDNGN